MSVRVRYAPSPTGMLHVGALRTVVFDSLFAQRNRGALILRIEDTDRTRYVADSEQEIIDSLKWVGIEFDEGPHVGGPFAPYRQSERKEAGIYAPYVQQLLDSGAAYKAFETPQELDEMREFQQINKMPTGYFGGAWREASPEQVAAAEAEGKPFVVRLKIPRGRRIELHDLVRGRLEWDGDTVDDPVLIKADGMPTYHFAAMVDDHLMEITHILRGEEWISSAPKHQVLFEAFGWQPPVFVHCPVIVGNDGKKLSKRHGATRVLDYAARGFLPEALTNFVALIGWSPKDEREIMTEAEMVERFDLAGIQPSPGRFDYDKLKHFNGERIRAMSAEELLRVVLEFIALPSTERFYTEGETEEGEPDRRAVWASLVRFREAAESDRKYVARCVALEQERISTLAEIGEACAFFLVDEVEFEPAGFEKWLRKPERAYLERLFDRLVAGSERGDGVEHWETELRRFAEEEGLEKLGPVVHPTRVALTGKTVGPGLFELMSVLGPERIRRRVARVRQVLG